MKLDHQLRLHTKINSRWIKDLNISHNTIKVLDKNMARKISDISRSNILTDMSPKARDIKERINKWDLIKIRSFCTAKENSTKLQREQTVWENIFANDTSDKGLISKIYHSFLIHSFTDGHLGYFQHLAIVSCSAMNIGVHRFFWIGVSGSLG